MSHISASDVANYFLRMDALDENADGISNLKMQKLVYYAYGFYYGLYHQPLFEDEIQAWPHGPVILSLQQKYHTYGNSSIPFNPETSTPTAFSEEQEDFLQDIYWEFSQYSAWKLADMTHDEAPWEKARANTTSTIIPAESIHSYFQKRVA